MRFSRPLLDACTAAFAAVLPLEHPADSTLSAFFRAHPKIGQRDRGTVAESVYAMLRRRRLLERAAATRDPRRLALATWTALLGANLRELEAWLRGDEAAWLASVKRKARAPQSVEIECELPDWALERLRRRFAEDELLALAKGLLQSAPLDLRANLVKTTREAAIERLAADGLSAVAAPYSAEGIRLGGKPAINRHPLFLEGCVEVQDEGSQLLCHLVAPKRGEMVADFCAGAGGKTLALGALMRSSGRLYAFDVSAKRLARLRPRLARSGLSNVHPQRIEGENDARVKRLAGKIDRVLVDAPCSGLGTLRRNPDLKWRQTPQGVGELAMKQQTILAAASRLVKPGGRLVYATCSILEEENRRIVEGFLGHNAEFALRPAGEALRKERIDLEMGEYLELWPHRHGTDGFFAAVLERNA
ncbi:MAG TPA: RsmB/NOP family class I SAM-dependent RNA methyltransferase [Burkholderiales bacterium]|nr:RsmB/NOP family class I SAM-dependent RNA methyltransferase [Burkholderiales bacterium]